MSRRARICWLLLLVRTARGAWLKKCKHCDKYIALSKGNRRIITEAEAKAIVRAMEKAHAAVKIMTKIIAEVKSDGENKSDHLSN